MKNTLPSVFLLRHPIKDITSAWYPYVLISLLILPITLFGTWDESDAKIVLFSWMRLNVPTNQRALGLSYVFDDFFAVYWLCVIMAFIPKYAFHTLTNSFTISNLLFLRLNPISPSQIALFRILLVVLSALFYAGLGWIWAIIFSLRHGISLAGPAISAFGLFCHILFSGGTLLLFQLPLAADISDRRRWMYFFIFAPIFIYMIGNQLIETFHGFFPFAAPFILRMEGLQAVKPLLTTMTVAGIFIILHYVFTILKSRQKPFKI